LIDWCAENALLTAREYWDNQSIQLLRPKAVAGIEPYASRLKAPPDEVIRIYEPSDITHRRRRRRDAGRVEDDQRRAASNGFHRRA
jgi:hypothetical protein